MSTMASQITSLTLVYSSVHSGADQRKHQSSASLAFVPGIYRWPVNSPHKRPVTWKMFPFDDVIMKRKDINICFNCENAHRIVMLPRNNAAFNTLRPRHIDRHFPDDVSKCIFLNEKVWISIGISLKFVFHGPTYNMSTLFQILIGEKPLSEPMMPSLLKHICVIRPDWVNGLTGH